MTVDQVAVVSGGSGIVGSGITVEFLKQGAIVWAPLRNEQRFDELKSVTPKDLHGNLRFYKSDLGSEQDFDGLKAEILKKDGKLNHVVSCFGGWQEHGPLSTLSLKDYKAAVDYYTVPHFLMYKTFAKILSETPKSTFTSIQGGGADLDVFFSPTASILPIIGRTIVGQICSGRTEFQNNDNIHFIQYRIGVWVRREADEKFKAENKSMEVGNDYIAKFLPKMIQANKHETYRLNSREEGDKLFNSFN